MKKTVLLDKKVIDILEYRIKKEEESSRLYEQMSLWLNDNGYLNTSKLYKIYANEENNHSDWAKSFLLDYGITPTLMPLSSPVIELNTLQDVFEATLEYELLITKECEELASEALKLNNHIL